jgi:hypothetical protein
MTVIVAPGAALSVLLPGNNLSDLQSPSAALENLGLSGTSYMPALAIATSQTTSFTAAPNTLYPIGAALTVSLPSNAPVGSLVGIQRSGSFTTTISPVAGTINGESAATIAASGTIDSPFVLVMCTAAATWQIISAQGTDAGLGFRATSYLVAATEFSFLGAFYGHVTAKTSGTYTTSYLDWWVELSGTVSAVALGVTNYVLGQQVVLTNVAATAVALTAAGGTLYGPSSLPPQSGAIFQYDGTNWFCVASWGTSPNSAQRAAQSAPTFVSGTAAQLAQTIADAMLYVTVTLGGTFTLAMGSTSAVTGITPFSAVTVVAGQTFSVRVPAGWYVKITTTTATYTCQVLTC